MVIDVNVKLLVIRDVMNFAGNTLRCTEKVEPKENGKRVKDVPERSFTSTVRSPGLNPDHAVLKQ